MCAVKVVVFRAPRHSVNHLEAAVAATSRRSGARARTRERVLGPRARCVPAAAAVLSPPPQPTRYHLCACAQWASRSRANTDIKRASELKYSAPRQSTFESLSEHDVAAVRAPGTPRTPRPARQRR